MTTITYNHIAWNKYRSNKRRGELGWERRNLANRRQDKPLRDEIKAAIKLANDVLLEMASLRECDHEILESVCPCHEQPYNPRFDIEAPAVQ